MECLSGICTSIVEKAAEFTAAAIGRQIGYFFTYESNIDNLESQIQELKHAKERVDRLVDAAKNNGDEIFGDVQNWQSKAEAVSAEAEKLLRSDEGEGSSGSLTMRYKLSKRAEEMAQAITEILDGRKFDKVSHRLPPQDYFKLKGYEEFGSRAHTFLGIMEALRDNGVGLIRVWGMGGIGKTMLVKQVAQQAKGENLFSKVIIATVSQNPDYKAIQDEVAEHLGLKFDENTRPVRAKRLQARLRQKRNDLEILDDVWSELDLEEVGISFSDDQRGCKIVQTSRFSDVRCANNHKGKERNVLVILDDVWSELDLEEVGISFSDDQRGCKIVLTSRLRDVRCVNHKGEEKIFAVGVLSASESETLFSQIVGDQMKESEFQNLGIQIVKECGGLPLVISAVAHALKRQIYIPVWKDALKQMEVSNIEEVGNNVYSSITLSYKFLQSDAKSLLLLCSLYEEDANIALDDLRNYCSGLCLFQRITKLEDVRNRVIRLVEDLKACSLLLDGRSASFVKIHDVIRDVCISIASTDRRMYNIRNVTELNERLDNKELENSTAVSLHCDNDDGQLPERLLCLKLKLFSLSSTDRQVNLNYSKTQLQSHYITRQSLLIPNQFFEGSEEIQVLCLKQVNLNCPQLSSFQFLQNLNALLLPGCQLEDVSLIGELKNLKILDLSRSHIKMVPKQLGQLTRLRSLSLYDCHNLKEIQHGVISSFFLLEELRVGTITYGECKEANVDLSELKDLGHVTMLDMIIPDPKALPNDLFTKKLERYALIVGCDWIHHSSKQYSRSLHLGTMSQSVIEQSGLKFLIKKAEVLEIKSLKSVRDVGNELDENGLPQLNVLVINKDDAVRYIINSTERRVIHGCRSAAAFQNLRELYLSDLPNLEKICNGNEISMASFKKLTVIEVETCPTLKNLFHFPTACRQLETIQVHDCEAVEEIFTYGGREEIDSDHEDAEMIEFPRLSSLEFSGLPKLTQFCREVKKINTDVGSGEFPLFHHELPGNSTCFQSLTNLHVSDCKSLKYLFSSSVAASLARLNRLEIENCDGIRAIIRNDQGTDVKVLLPRLNYLELSYLPNLTSFLKENNLSDNVTSLFNYKMEFPNLKELVLSSLWQLGTIWRDCDELTSDYMCKLEYLCISYCENLTNLFSSHDQSNEEIRPHITKYTFEKLNRVTVAGCPSLKSVFPKSVAKGLLRLESLRIEDCHELQQVIEKEEVDGTQMIDTKFVFPKLTCLQLTRMRELVSFYPGLHSLEWPSLESLRVIACRKFEITPLLSVDKVQSPNLKHILLEGLDLLEVFSYETLRRLQSLRHLTITACPTMECIFAEETPIHAEEKFDNTVPTQINGLMLFKLPKLKQVVAHNSTERTLSFLNLTYLHMRECDGMVHFLTPSTARSMQQLKKLTVENCKGITEIIKADEGGGDTQETCEIIFSQLEVLILDVLPNLTSFHSGSCALIFPNLTKAIVHKCSEFQSFSSGAKTPRLKAIICSGIRNPEMYVGPTEEAWNGDINTTLQELYDSSHEVVEEEEV